MLDISKDDILDDTTFIDIPKFNEKVEREIKMHNHTLHHMLTLDMVVYYDIIL